MDADIVASSVAACLSRRFVEFSQVVTHFLSFKVQPSFTDIGFINKELRR